MSRRSLVLAAAAGATAASATAAGAAPRFVALPSPTSSFRVSPPLQANGATGERRVPGPIRARIAVRVTLDRDGRPVRVTAVDRLLLRATGDYSFSVPAPALDAVPAAGSESAPGLRQGAVLWQGFAAKRRLLAALITLRPEAAAGSLPLHVSIDRGRVEIANATATATSAGTANAASDAVAARLDAARAALASGRGQTAATVPARGPVRTVPLTIVAPIRVAGVYRFGAEQSRRIAAVVAGKPLRLRGHGRLTQLELSAAPLSPRDVLRPPARRSWKASAAAGGLGRDPVLAASRRLLEAALATQYATFLANPDQFGPSTTSYRYALGAAPTTSQPSHGSGSAWIGIAVALGFAAVLTGGVVLWAHS
jgi:hypothetical protein